MSTIKKGVVNGSDMLCRMGGNCFGHCTDTTVNFDSETKTRAVKPVGTAALQNAKFKMVSVVGQNITVSFSGLVAYDETEQPVSAMLLGWHEGSAVVLSFFNRSKTEAANLTSVEPWLAGNFVITKLTVNNPADDDATYSGEATISGAPTLFDPSKLLTEAGVAVANLDYGDD